MAKTYVDTYSLADAAAEDPRKEGKKKLELYIQAMKKEPHKKNVKVLIDRRYMVMNINE